MTGKPAMTVELPSDTEILMRCSFNAPRQLVFDAFTEPEHLVHWWGPRGTSLTCCEVDLRPGGKWRMVIRDAGEEEHAFGGAILELEPPRRFVWTFGWDGMPGQEGPEEMIFTEVDDKTTVTTRSTFPDKETRDAMLRSGMEEGATQSYERLAERLATIA